MGTIQAAILSAVAVLFFSLGIVIYTEHLTINNLRDQLQAANDQKAACDATNQVWKDRSEAQNAAIDTLKNQMAQREKDTGAAVASAQKERDQAVAAAGAILGQKVDADDCVGAKQVLQSYLNGRKP